MAELKTLSTIDTSPFKRLVLNLGAAPTAFTEGMTYYELLAWLVKFLEDEVVPKTNESIEGLKELQTYVSTYFDNLDVQEEINNKLDQMAEDGTLQAIIESYINLNALIVYETLADLKASEALISGMTVRTLGYHTKGDGGSAIYRIREVTNQDTEDDRIIVPITNNVNLIAEFIPLNSELFAEQFGAYGDGANDDTTAINAAIAYCETSKLKLVVNKTYLITSTITLPSNIFISANKSYTDSHAPFTFIYTGENYLFEIQSNTNAVKLENISIKGNGDNSGVQDHGYRNTYDNVTFYNFVIAIYFNKTAEEWRGEQRVNKCLFYDTSETAIKIYNVVDSSITDCIIRGTGYAITGTFISWLFSGNHDYTAHGLDINPAAHSQILNNYFDHADYLPMIKIRTGAAHGVMINNNKFITGSSVITNTGNHGIINFDNQDWGASASICNNICIGVQQNQAFIKLLGSSQVKFSCTGNLIDELCNKLMSGIINDCLIQSPNITLKTTCTDAGLTSVNKNIIEYHDGLAHVHLDINNAPASIVMPFQTTGLTNFMIYNLTDSTTVTGRMGLFNGGQTSNLDTIYTLNGQGKRIIIDFEFPLYRGNALNG